MSKEVYVFVPVKVIINKDEEVIGLVEPVSLDVCDSSLKELGYFVAEDFTPVGVLSPDSFKDLVNKVSLKAEDIDNSDKENVRD